MKPSCLHLSLAIVAILFADASSALAKPEPPVPNSRPPRLWLPALYDKLGLTPEQEQQLKTLYAEYQTKINKLTGEIARLQSDRRQAAENVLTDEQRSRLRQIQDDIRSRARQRQSGRQEVPPPSDR
jgi:Spy/CpxP family protein refolding chaperone